MFMPTVTYASPMSKCSEFEFYSINQLASLLDVKPDWLNHNRASANPIPFKKLGRFIRYSKSEVQTWLGVPEIELNFWSTQTLAEQLNVSVVWVKNNRRSKRPIPFHRFNYLIRYQKTDVVKWIEENHF